MRVYHSLSGIRPNRGSKTIGHEHEQSLRRRAQMGIGSLVNEQRTRDVEKVKSHSVYYHRGYKHPYARSWVARSKKSKTQHPGKHGYEHYILNAETLHKEWNHQYAECLTNL